MLTRLRGANIVSTLAKLIVAILLLSSCASAAKVEVVRAERELAHALDVGDVEKLRGLWADALLFTFPNGTMLGKDERLRAISASRAQAELTSTIDELQIKIYGSTAVTSVLTTWSPGGRRYRATHVWARDHGRWRLAAAHVSALK